MAEQTPEQIKAAADKAAAEAAATAAAKAAAEKKDPLEAFNEYLETLDPEIRKTIEEFTANLKNALVSERGLNKGVKDRLARLDVLEAAEKKKQEAEMTEVQKANAAREAAEAEQKRLKDELLDERIKNAVLAAAKDFADPQDAYAMLDLDLLEIDEKTGKILGVEEAIKALVKKKPYLLGTEEARPRYNIEGSDKGKGLKTGDIDAVKKKKRESGRYHKV